MLKQKNQVDVVVADLNLVDASSTDTINRLTRSFAHLPIILLTGANDLELARQAVRSGIQAYMIKDMQSADTLNLALLQATEHFKLTQSLKYTINNLYQKSRVQNQITRSMTHDYRSPVNNIISLLQLIDKDPDNTGMYIEKAVISGRRMLKNLEDNIALLRSPSGMENRPEVFNLARCVDEVAIQIESEMGGAEILCNFEVPEVRYPPVYIKGYLLNLVSNSIKYRHPRREPKINISSKLCGTHICLSVQDNGMGIDLEKYGSKLFGFKQRFHDTVASGTGLGLFNLKNQIESLNGKVEVESVEGEGSTFVLYLPKF